MTSPDPAIDPAIDHDPEPALTVLWRPGCGFCSRLTRRLDAHGIVYRQRNIWEDDAARSLLRSAIGCETVPTVLVGDTVLVNPSADEAVAGLALVAPEQVPGDYEPTRPGPIGRLVRRALAGEPHELATEA